MKYKRPKLNAENLSFLNDCFDFCDNMEKVFNGEFQLDDSFIAVILIIAIVIFKGWILLSLYKKNTLTANKSDDKDNE